MVDLVLGAPAAFSEPSPLRVRVLGGDVDLVTPAEVMDFTARAVAERRGGIVANHNLHSLSLIRRDPSMRAFYDQADLIEADSTPMIAWGALLGLPIRRRHRATYLDWREDFWRVAREKGWRVFHLGGAPGVAERAAEAIRCRWPGVTLGVRHGVFEMTGPQNAAVVEELRAFRPDVLLVGMGMPRQERWLLNNLAALQPCVAFPIGGAFDYEAGAVPTPPRWTGRLGVEWLARFCAEPRRLFTRYFVEPWTLVPAALTDVGRAVAGRASQSTPRSDS